MKVITKKQKKICVLVLSYLHFSLLKKNTFVSRRLPRWWVRDIFRKRKEQGAFYALLPEMRLNDPEKYFNYLRITPDQFHNLLKIVGPQMEKHFHVREPINPAERLSLTLRYLASGDSMVSLSYAFRIGKQTVSNIIRETCKALWSALQHEVFKEPSEHSWVQYAKEFELFWNFPHCVGAIDGKHVVMQAPPHSGSQFYNYKGSHSIVLMALCDAKYKFIAVDIGAPGRQSDGGIFRKSEIGRRLFNGKFPIPIPIEDGGDDVPYFIVGDAAFPLTTNLMRPYAGKFLPLHKRVFNYRLSRARRVSENTLGILVARWRLLRKPIIASLETIENATKAVVVLHNWLMSNKQQNAKYCPIDYLDTEDVLGNVTPGLWRADKQELCHLGRLGSNMYNADAGSVRETLALHFCSDGALSFQWNRV